MPGGSDSRSGADGSPRPTGRRTARRAWRRSTTGSPGAVPASRPDARTCDVPTSFAGFVPRCAVLAPFVADHVPIRLTIRRLVVSGRAAVATGRFPLLGRTQSELRCPLKTDRCFFSPQGCVGAWAGLRNGKSAPPAPVDHARDHGVRRPVFFDNEQKRVCRTACLSVHHTNDRIHPIQELDPVLPCLARHAQKCNQSP